MPCIELTPPGRPAPVHLAAQYHDQLLEDMGARPRRKGLNVFAECFGTYSAHDCECRDNECCIDRLGTPNNVFRVPPRT